jgi:hypothetical protein
MPRMRRLGRVLLNLLTALSALLCVVACVLWARSYWRCDRIAAAVDDPRPLKGRYASLNAYRGRLLVMWMRVDVTGTGIGYESKPLRPEGGYVFDLEPGHYFAGFQYYPRPMVGSHEVGFAGAPLWFVAALAGVAPARALSRVARRRRRKAGGLCLSCGYDLRAASGRCPECGAESEKETTAARRHAAGSPAR